MNTQSLTNTWKSSSLQKLALLIKDGSHGSHSEHSGGIPLLSAKDIQNGKVNFTNNPRLVSIKDFEDIHKNYTLKDGDILITLVGSIGRVAIVENYANNYTLQRSVGIFRPSSDGISKYLYYAFNETNFQRELSKKENKGAQGGVYLGNLGKIRITLPPLTEQKRIVAVLETWDKAIEKMKNKIKIKSQIKKHLMSKVLTGKKRLKGFTDPWRKVKLNDISINLDNKRVPINSGDREKQRGLIPYCGANGIVDYIDEYIFDEDLILIAEDGGQFDEYATRPIAYRMTGKFWVNNHAHVIKAKMGFSQDLLFYLTVNKNILKYLNGGTRAKLNKSELSKLEYLVPSSEMEQNAIADLLNYSSREIDLLNKKLTLLQVQKKYLLNNLITGKIRTPENLLVN